MKTINLGQYRPNGSTSFVGRPQGEKVREAIGLNEIDFTHDKVEIIIPNDTSSFNPSFFLGLLYNSIKNLGGVDNFNRKYHIVITSTSSIIKAALQKNINDGFRNANNSLQGKNGLNIF